MENQLKETQNPADKFSHIKGWGIDADPENEPTYPMKNYTGDDHKRLAYVRPKQQVVDVEKLHSNERPSVSAVFGTTVPPSGLSGQIRRFAFRYSESTYAHWLPLMLADRVNVVEGFIDDLRHGFVPNIFKEKGWKAEMEHAPAALAKKVFITAAVTTALVTIIIKNWNKEKA